MGYSHVAQKLESAIDCFTPSLLYKDTSIYGVGGYNILSQSSKWKSSSFVGNISSVLPILDLAIEGNYYDSLYTINYTKLITYQHSAYIWLSVNEKLITNVSISSITPKSMKVMISYIVNLQTARDLAKNNCVKYNDLDKSFNDANVLFQLIKARILSGNIIGLIDSFNQLYTITHSYCQFLYTNTNLIIPPYDLSSWGSLGTSSNSGAFTAFYTASIDGETVCPFIIPSNARIDYVKNEIKTLFPSQYTWTGANIILGGGIQLSQGQTIEVHYII